MKKLLVLILALLAFGALKVVIAKYQIQASNMGVSVAESVSIGSTGGLG